MTPTAKTWGIWSLLTKGWVYDVMSDGRRADVLFDTKREAKADLITFTTRETRKGYEVRKYKGIVCKD